MKFSPIPLMAFCLIAGIASSQDDSRFTLFLQSGHIQIQKNNSSDQLQVLQDTAVRYHDQAFVLIQFFEIPTGKVKQQMAEAGIVLLNYLPSHAYTAAVSGMPASEMLTKFGIRAVHRLLPQQKMSRFLSTDNIPPHARPGGQYVDLWLSFARIIAADTVKKELIQRGFEITHSAFEQYAVFGVRTTTNRLKELAALPFVEYIEPAPHEPVELNYKNTVNARANILQSSLPGGRNLNGNQVVVGVGDNSNLLNHVDFSGRLINRAAVSGGAHGVHVSGIVGGAGIINEKFSGFATKATILKQLFSNILTYAPAYIQDHGMVITNNSYGNVVNDCSYFGLYTLYSSVLDQQSRQFKSLQHVFAAGNSAGYNCNIYPPGYATVLGDYQSAKNVLTVGSTDERSVISSFSSRGPVRDGRIKPEVVTQGSGVFSTWPVNIYSPNNGTSMASPGAAGGLTLLYQRYRQLNAGNNPPNGLIKALVCNGATDLGNPGPDYLYGFGWLNLLRSVKMMEYSAYFNDSVAQGAQKNHQVSLASGNALLKVMLYWNDPAAAAVSPRTLVNDLDLEVINPAGQTILPLCLDTLPSAVQSNAVPRTDHINNIEQVVISNPASGQYTFRVKGTSVAQNPVQDYFLVFDSIPVSTTLIYPYGGEKLLPADSLYIQWESYGDPSGTFSLSYTTDGGQSWTPIDDAIPASTRLYKWFAPAVTTEKARIRLLRNSNNMQSTSSDFVILGAPVLTLAPVQCEGYLSVNWTAVPGATDYEVMMLQGSEMQSKAILNSLTYTFSGLSADSVYYVTVRARMNAAAGRRALAVSRKPDSGNCSGNISDYDLKLQAILSPAGSGRLLTSSALQTAHPVVIRIKNLDDAATSGNISVSYTVNGAAPVTETILNPIGPGAVLDYTFSTSVNLATAGNYDISVQISYLPDPVLQNNSLQIQVRQLANLPVNLSLVYLDQFDTAPEFSLQGTQVGFPGLDRYDFSASGAAGRIRSFVNTGIAYSGNRSLTLDAERYVSAGVADSLTATFNLATANASMDDIRLDFRYKNHGQVLHAANRVWIRGNDMQNWIEVYNLAANQYPPDGRYQSSASIELSDWLQANGQNYSSSFQVRWGQFGQHITSGNDGGAGYSFDDVRLYRVLYDMQMIRIDTPSLNSCGLSAATPVKITVRNSHNTALNAVPVQFRVDGGTWTTEVISSVPANSTLQFQFTATANLSQLGAHRIDARVQYPADNYADNDSISLDLVHTPVVIVSNTQPYLEHFENGASNWYTTGYSSWQFGTPASYKITKAASGIKAWKTTLAGSYGENQVSVLYSPCFNISSLSNPWLSFSAALDMEDCGNNLCDGAYIEYSADGINWLRLGAQGQGVNWYNKNYPNNHMWSIQNYHRWHVVSIPLPAGLSAVRFRFIVQSDPSVTREGMAIDDIHIYNGQYPIYNGPTMPAPVTKIINGGNSQVDFISNGKIVASMQPRNQQPGLTAVQAMLHAGSVRNFNGQYYLNRSLVVQAANRSLQDSVRLRIYFLDREADSMVFASTCSSCPGLGSAYELGVSQYTDSLPATENADLADDSLGLWHFISPASVVKVPYLDGYYAELATAGFSEFWLNTGGPGNVHPLLAEFMNFSVRKTGVTDAQSEWTMRSENYITRYEVEVARGMTDMLAGRFVKLGDVNGAGNSTTPRTYLFTDTEPAKSGKRYYRLKVIYVGGQFHYSEVREIEFYSGIVRNLYPNPAEDWLIVEYQLPQGQLLQAEFFDIAGKKITQVQQVASGLPEKIQYHFGSGIFPKGVYLCRISSGGKQETYRIVKQ